MAQKVMINGTYYYCTNIIGSRPAFTLPGTTEVQDNGDGTYSLTA